MESTTCAAILRSTSPSPSDLSSRRYNEISLNTSVPWHQSSTPQNSTRADMNRVTIATAIPIRSFNSTHFNTAARTDVFPPSTDADTGGRSIIDILDEAINIADEVLSIRRSDTPSAVPTSSSGLQQDINDHPLQ